MYDWRCPVQLLSIRLPLLDPLLNELPARQMVMFGKSSLPHIPLFLPGVNNADRIIGICCPQIKVVSALRNDQCCRSSDRLEDSSAGPGVEQPVAEDDVGGGLEASSSVKGVGKGWPMGRVEYSICKILRLK